MSAYLLGLDIGTSNVKAVLVERREGREGGEGKSTIQDVSVPLGKHVEVKEVEGACEREVAEVWSCLEACLDKLDPCKLQRVCGIGVCGQMHGCVLWNEALSGAPSSSPASGSCSNLITWQDGRCSGEFLSSLPATQRSSSPSTGYGCATLAWLKRYNPDVLKEFNRAGTIMDLVMWRLCNGEDVGGAKPVVMSAQNAASWGYFDMDRLQWEMDM